MSRIEFDLAGWVREFHVSFGLPAPDEVSALSRADRVTRDRFLKEELTEYRGASGATEEVDALADLAYFAMGSVVMIGYKPEPFTDDGLRGFSPSANKSISYFYGRMANFMAATQVGNQVAPSLAICVRSLGLIASYGVLPSRILRAVHEANMRKLFPDGKPRYRESDGKVLKPPGWYGPETEIEMILKETRYARMD